MIRKIVLTTMTIVFLLCPPVKANQHSVSTVKETIIKHSLELGIDPALALSIAKSESGFRHEAKSRHGAVGVFQLMPSTAKRLGINPYYLSDNIKGGLMYYKRLYDMFGSTELALAAYNAGPGVVKKYKKVPQNCETSKFVYNIMSEYHRQKAHPDPLISKLKASDTPKSNKHAHTMIEHVKVEQHKRIEPVTLKPTPAVAKHSVPAQKSVIPTQGVV